MTDLTNYKISHKTERLILETLTPENMSDDYVAWFQDPDVLQYLEARHTTRTREKIIGFVQNMLESKDNLMLGIFLKGNKKHIGNIKLGPVNKIYKRGDIGLVIGDKGSWGKGYATEAINGVCDIAFKTLALRRVQAGAYASNKASVRAFEKAGFSHEGVFKDYWLLDNEPEDEIMLARLAGD